MVAGDYMDDDMSPSFGGCLRGLGGQGLGRRWRLCGCGEEGS